MEWTEDKAEQSHLEILSGRMMCWTIGAVQIYTIGFIHIITQNINTFKHFVGIGGYWFVLYDNMFMAYDVHTYRARSYRLMGFEDERQQAVWWSRLCYLVLCIYFGDAYGIFGWFIKFTQWLHVSDILFFISFHRPAQFLETHLFFAFS